MKRPKMKGMRSAARLKYGQTVWDRLSRKRLLLLVCRYHQALSSTACCLRVSRCGGEDSPYWQSPQGMGGRALSEAEYLIQFETMSDLEREREYRMFFRSANGVLFPGLDLGDISKWWICEGCGQMCAGMGGNPTKHCKCAATWRPFTLRDIRPDLADAQEAGS